MLRKKPEQAAARLRGARTAKGFVLLAAAFTALVMVVLSSSAEPTALIRAASTLRPLGRWTVSGYVQSERGEAVAGARVCAVWAVGEAARQPPICSSSEASGAYALELSDHRPVTITASAPGYSLAHAQAGLPIRAHDASRADADIVLHGGGARIVGRVTDAFGKPVADTRVRLFRTLGALQSSVETRSDGHGRFELWAAPGGVTLRIEAPGFVPSVRSVMAPTESFATQLTPASSISGSVVDQSSGKPVAGVEVRALLEGKRGRGAVSASGHDGQFTLTGLDAGRYVITAEHERFRARDALALQIGLAKSQTSLTVPLVSAVSVLGKVVSSHGEACAGGRVSLDPANIPQPEAANPSPTVAHVELDGTLRLRGLTAGRYRVSVHCPEQVVTEGPSELVIQDHDLQVTWRVESGPGLDITVLDAAGKIVPRAGVVLRRTLFDQSERDVVTPMTGDDAGHVLTGTRLRPGRYTVRPNGGLQGEPVSVELQPGAGLVPVALRLRGSAYIDVDLHDHREQPVDGLRVTARAMGQGKESVETVVPARPEGGGAYRIGPLAAGRYAVSAADGVNRSWADAVTLADHATVRSSLVIERDARVSGQVLDAQGRPATNVWVHVKDEDFTSDPRQAPRAVDSQQRRLTDAQGLFEIDGLAQRGRFVISVSDAAAGERALHDVQPNTAVRLALAHPTPIASSAGDR